MSKFLTITVIPSTEHPCNVSTSSTNQVAKITKEIYQKYGDVKIRWHIDCTKGCAAWEKVLAFSKCAKKNNVEVSVLTHFENLQVFRPFAHLISQIEIIDDVVLPENVELAKKIILKQKNDIESLQKVNQSLKIVYRIIVAENNYTSINFSPYSSTGYCGLNIIKNIQNCSDFQFYSFLRNNYGDLFRARKSEECLVVSPKGTLALTNPARNENLFQQRKITERIGSLKDDNVTLEDLILSEVSLDGISKFIQEEGSGRREYDAETSKIIESMKNMFCL